MTIEFKVEGFSELEEALDQLSQSTGKSALRRAMKKAAQPLADLANAKAPVGKTGEYATSFSYSTRLNKRQGRLHRRTFKNDRASIEGFVGTNDPAGVQQEFGNVNHPPQPALRPAWDQDKMSLLDRLGQFMWAEIKKSMARAERKAARIAAKGM
ncbi:MAG: HK97-gp10 family putative phage morphogenesis protein [Cognatishimia activa]